MIKIFNIFITLIMLSSCASSYRTEKKFVIEKAPNFSQDQYSKTFSLEVSDWYYDEITVNLLPDSSYRIVYWGNRQSAMWDALKDNVISVNIPYNRHKGDNVDLDVKLFNTFNTK